MSHPFDPSSVSFSSTVFPTEADLAHWRSLTSAQQQAVLVHWEEQGFQSGKVPREQFEARMQRLLAL